MWLAGRMLCTIYLTVYQKAAFFHGDMSLWQQTSCQQQLMPVCVSRRQDSDDDCQGVQWSDDISAAGTEDHRWQHTRLHEDRTASRCYRRFPAYNTETPLVGVCPHGWSNKHASPVTTASLPDAVFTAVSILKFIQESPAVADKPAQCLRKVCTVYVRAVGL